MNWHIALGALVIVLSISGGALLSRLYAVPTGAHRAHRAAEGTVPLAELLRPQTAVNDIGWCPAEREMQLHAYDRAGGRTCWTCRTYTPAGAA